MMTTEMKMRIKRVLFVKQIHELLIISSGLCDGITINSSCTYAIEVCDSQNAQILLTCIQIYYMLV